MIVAHMNWVCCIAGDDASLMADTHGILTIAAGFQLLLFGILVLACLEAVWECERLKMRTLPSSAKCSTMQRILRKQVPPRIASMLRMVCWLASGAVMMMGLSVPVIYAYARWRGVLPMDLSLSLACGSLYRALWEASLPLLVLTGINLAAFVVFLVLLRRIRKLRLMADDSV